MKVKNLKNYRQYYRTHEAHSEDPKTNINFVGHSHWKKNGYLKFGFFQLFHGDKKDEKGFLRSDVLNIAADHQAVYELIQNADDACSEMILIDLNEHHLIALNLGEPFHYLVRDEHGNENKGRVASLLNVGQSDKGVDEIGTFGIGFKIVHRLLGEDDAADALSEDYKGSMIFSWFSQDQFAQFINENEEIESCENQEDSSRKSYPWLFKILMTCFPAGPGERVRDLNYKKFEAFTSEELNEFRDALKKQLAIHKGLRQENDFSEGVAIYIPLGPGKYNFIRDKLHMLNRGVSYSFNFLKNLERIYFQSERIDKKSIPSYDFDVQVGTPEFEEIRPRVKRDIEVSFAYFEDYQESGTLVEEGANIPNFYNYFAMEQEINKFRFLLHCNAFDMQSNRRELQPDSEINERLLPFIAKKVRKFILEAKSQNPELYRNLYAALLLSEEPVEKAYLNKHFFQPLTEFLFKHIPTINGFSNDSDSVKIKSTNLDITLPDFGFEGYEWFFWENTEEDADLIDEAQEVLGIEIWDIKDIVEQAEVPGLDAYFGNCTAEQIEEFLLELCSEGNIRRAVKDKLIDDVDFIPVGIARFNIKEIKESTKILLRRGFASKHKELLRQIGFHITDIDFEDERFDSLLGSIADITDATLFKKLDEKIIEDDDISEETCLRLFNIITDDEEPGCVLHGVSNKVPSVIWFKNQAGDYEEIGKMINPALKVPEWLLPYQPASKDFRNTQFFLQESEIFNHIIYPHWEKIIEAIELEGIEDFLHEVVTYFGKHDEELEAVRSLSNKTYFLTKGAWLSGDEPFVYLDEFQQIARYADMVDTFQKLSSQAIPSPEILPYLTAAPFKTPEQPVDPTHFIRDACKEGITPANAALVIGLNPKVFLEYFYIEERDGLLYFSPIEDKAISVLRSDSRLLLHPEIITQVQGNQLHILPASLKQFDENLIDDDTIITHIVQDANLNEHLDYILSFPLPLEAFKGLIDRNDWILSIDPDNLITEDSSAYNFFKLVERHYYELDGVYPKLKKHIRILQNGEWQGLPEQNTPADTLEFNGKNYQLSKLLPKTYALHGILNHIKTQLTELEIKSTPINKALGLSPNARETNAEQIVSLLKSELPDQALENEEQLNFVLEYMKDFYGGNPSGYDKTVNPFKVHTKGGLKTLYYNSFFYKDPGAFIDPSYVLLREQYPNFDNRLFFNGTAVKYLPGIEAKKIDLTGLKTDLSDQEKQALLDFLMEQYFSKPNASGHLQSMDEASLRQLAEKLEFNYQVTLCPSTLALPSEQAPGYLQAWLSNSEDSERIKKEMFLPAIGIRTPESPIVRVRQCLLDHREPSLEDLREHSSGQLRTLMSFIAHKKLTFDNRPEAFDLITRNIKAQDNDFFVAYHPDEDALFAHSQPLQNNAVYDTWREAGYDWEIRIYNGENGLPHLVQSSYTGTYILYRINQGEVCTIERTIYALPDYKDDIGVLLVDAKVEKEARDAFRNITLHQLDTEIHQNGEEEQLDEKPYTNRDIERIEQDIKNIGLDIPEEDRISINFEALILGWDYLKSQGFDVGEAILGGGTIANIYYHDPDTSLLIKVRSGRNGIFFLNAGDWKSLADNNTYLLVYSGGGRSGFRLILDQAALIKHFCREDNYQIIRLKKTEDTERLTNMVDTLMADGGQGHFIFRSDSAKKKTYESIFETFKRQSSQSAPSQIYIASDDEF